jgi:hypothetical protein
MQFPVRYAAVDPTDGFTPLAWNGMSLRQNLSDHPKGQNSAGPEG